MQDYESGAILYEKNADQPMNPAQTVKLMTAEIVFNEIREGRLHLDDKFTVSENAWRTGGAHGHSTAMFLDVKSQARVEDLIRGLAIQSGNDAAIMFAEGIAGSEDGFVLLMNKRARSAWFNSYSLHQFVWQERPRAAHHGARHGRARRASDPRLIPTTTNISARRISPGTRSIS